MTTIELTTDNVEAVVTTHPLVLVDFWASWCGPCRRFGPIFEAASERHPEVVFAKVDTEAQPELAAAVGVRAIPTVAVFRDGIGVHVAPGALGPGDLDRLIGQVQSLDMPEIRRRLEAQEAAAS